MRAHPILLLIVFLGALPASGAETVDVVTRGKSIFEAADCMACHTDTSNKGPLLAGGRKLETPFGVFYSPNITADPKTGIGAWSDDDFIRALRHGLTPDDTNLFPVFPYPSYTLMTDADMRALKAYIFSLPPVARENRGHEVKPPFGWRYLLTFWKALFFSPGAFHLDPGHDIQWNRGAYLATALGHCGECHTPRNVLGAPKADMALAGTSQGPDGGTVPNITPDPATGIGKWSDDDLDSLLTLGMKPDGDFVGGGMAEVVSNSTAKLTPADRKALIAYLKSLPPVVNAISHKPAN